MSYIGRTPQIGAYHKLDAITTDGSASYTMQLNSANFVPESVNHLIVSVNGVIQAPTDSFTVSSSTITFASSLSASDTIDFIMALGNVLDIGVPSDSTVSLSKLTATGTPSASTFLRGDNSWASAGGENTPYFKITMSSAQAFTGNVTTKVNFDTATFDSDSGFDAVNDRWTVPSGKDGYYYLFSTVMSSVGSNSHRVQVRIRVNGSSVAVHYSSGITTKTMGKSFTLASLQAGDYVETYITTDSTGTQNIDNSNTASFLQGFRIIT